MSAADAGTVRLTKVARILTEVFAPPILVVTLLVVVGINSTSSIGQGLLLSAVTAFFAAGLPYAIMLVGIRRGRLSDRHLSLREQRPAIHGNELAAPAGAAWAQRLADLRRCAILGGDRRLPKPIKQALAPTRTTSSIAAGILLAPAIA